MTRRLQTALAAAAAAAAVTACAPSDASAPAGPAARLRLGYFANVTHATALAGVGEGFFARALGATKLETQVFNAGPAAVEALFAGGVDAAYVGPNPAVNAYARSRGAAIRIVAGATSGGASLVVRPGIAGAAQLRGRTLASPQLGGTQDVALRAWLKSNGLRTSPSGRGDVTITPADNATTLQLFRDGRIDGAWVPEPWASRLVLEAGAEVLVDERTLWPDGRFVTTQLVVTTRFLTAHRETVRALVAGSVAATAWLTADPRRATAAVNEQLAELTSLPLPQPVIERAWRQLSVTDDPVAASLPVAAAHAVDAGLLPELPRLDGIYDLRLLNDVLAAAGRPPVADAGLGRT